jgi:hypothetical protein
MLDVLGTIEEAYGTLRRDARLQAAGATHWFHPSLRRPGDFDLIRDALHYQHHLH